jgi:hypothetical protein
VLVLVGEEAWCSPVNDSFWMTEIYQSPEMNEYRESLARSFIGT